MTLYLGLFPVFLFKPKFFLYFLFLVTPGLRILAKNEIIFQNDFYLINFNFVINLSILFFGGIFLITKKTELIKIIKNSKFTYLLLFFTLISGLSILYSIDKSNSLDEFIRIVGIVIIYFYARLIIKDKKDFLHLLAIIILGTIIPIRAAIFQFFTGSGWWDKTIMEYRIQGTFLHPATFAFYLLILLPLIWTLIKNNKPKIIKAFFLVLLLSFSLLIMATLARVAWLGALLMLLVYGALKNRKILILSFLILFISYLTVPVINNRINDVFSPKYNSSFSTRLRIYETSLPAFFKSPLIGQGLGSFDQIHLKLNDEAKSYESLQAHNDYLRLLIELGLIGLFLYLGIFLTLFMSIYKNYKKGDAETQSYLFGLALIWIGALSISMGDNILRTMEVQYLLWAITGATLAYLGIKKAAVF